MGSGLAYEVIPVVTDGRQKPAPAGFCVSGALGQRRCTAGPSGAAHRPLPGRRVFLVRFRLPAPFMDGNGRLSRFLLPHQLITTTDHPALARLPVKSRRTVREWFFLIA